MSSSLQPYRLQHARLSCPLPSSGVCSNSCPLSWWCHPSISPSVVCFSSCPQIFPSIRVFSSESALPVNIQGWFPLGLTGLIFLISKGLSRAFSSTTVRKHQCFGAQLQLSGCRKKNPMSCIVSSILVFSTSRIWWETKIVPRMRQEQGEVRRTASRTQFCHLSSGSREWTWVAQVPFRVFD